MKNLPSNRTGCGLSSQERAEHREWIGGRVLTLLSHYWRDDDPVELTGAIARDWADVLEGLPQEYIQRACITYQRREPRRKPTPGAIYDLAKKAMPRPEYVPVQRMPRNEAAAYLKSHQTINPERAKAARAILAEIFPTARKGEE